MKTINRTKNPINKIAYYLATESGRDEEVILFGFRLFLTTLLGYASLIIISLWLNILPYTLPAAITTSAFRIFSGGAHASSQIRCSTIGLIIFIPLGYLIKLSFTNVLPSLSYLLIFMALLGMYITYKYVPADTPGKPITSKVQRTYLRAISFTLLFIWFIISIYLLKYQTNIFLSQTIYASSLGLFWQLITLTPFGYQVYEILDHILIIITEWRCKDEKSIS